MTSADAHAYGPKLLPHHAQLLADSGIDPAVAEARGYRSVQTKAELGRLGFSPGQCLAPGLLVPVCGVTGEIVTYQLRPDEPRIKNNKPLKYENPAGLQMVLDVPATVRTRLKDPAAPLVVTEGCRKADAAVSRGLACVALLGVWNWRGTNGLGGKTALPDWEDIALKDRKVYIVFDSDVMEKREVYGALARLKAFLASRGAHVLLIYLPPGEGGAKVGLDDYLADGHTVQELLGLATPELRLPPGGDARDARELPYRETPSGLIWDKPTPSGTVPVYLANFTAKIVADVAQDDGSGDLRRTFEIEAALRGRVHRFEVPAEKYAAMGWPTEHMGATAIVSPGQGTRDHARAAIQMLSNDVVERRVYKHTGWLWTGEAWSYLHAGGAIGPQGPLSGIDVQLSDGLECYALPDPPDGAELVRAIRASSRILDLAADQVTVPPYAATWRAPLGPADYSITLVGRTGVGKSELAALHQQHFGPGMDRLHLPGAFLSTGNSNEGLAFLVKDSLLVIDDFAPAGSQADIQRYHRDADRVLRAQGNNSGRRRMRPDGSLRAARPPRGTILVTGEDVARGQSVRARQFILELSYETLDWARVTEAQADAAGGLYARAMAGYVRWLAARYEDVRRELRDKVVRLREQAMQSAAHRRTPEIVANLAAGVGYFLAYAVDAGALSQQERDALWGRCWRALGEAAGAQAEHQAASEPTRRFLELVAAALASGTAHVAGQDGQAPQYVAGGPTAWGWREYRGEGGWAEDDDDRVSYRALGGRIGWVGDDGLYLNADGVYAAVQRLARDQGDALTVTLPTLKRRLHERGLLASIEHRGGRDRLEVRRVLENERRYVLHLHADCLIPPDVAHVARGQQPEADATNETGPSGAADGPQGWATSEPEGPEVAHESGPFEGLGVNGRGPDGPQGPQGPLPETQDVAGEPVEAEEVEWTR